MNEIETLSEDLTDVIRGMLNFSNLSREQVESVASRECLDLWRASIKAEIGEPEQNKYGRNEELAFRLVKKITSEIKAAYLAELAR